MAGLEFIPETLNATQGHTLSTTGCHAYTHLHLKAISHSQFTYLFLGGGRKLTDTGRICTETPQKQLNPS